jgi:hypothetical protein
MKQNFFSLSEQCFKYRRNLLFFALLCIVHLVLLPISSWSEATEALGTPYLDLLLLLVLLWFSANYFYYLFTERTEWKASFLSSDDLHKGIQASIWHSYTLVPEIQTLSDNKIIVRAELSSSKTIFDKSNKSEDDISRDMIDVMEVVEEEIKTGLMSDIKRIAAFQNSIKRYGVSHSIRYYVLDALVPAFTLLLVVGLLARKYFLLF